MPRKKTLYSSSTRRKALLSKFSNSSISMHPCGYCSSKSIPCKVSDASEYCEECVRLGRSCDLIITAADWARLDRAKEKLRKQLEEAEEQISAASMARLRLRKQLGLVKKREREMFSRELRNIESLEEDERAAGLLPEVRPRIDDPGVTLYSDNWLSDEMLASLGNEVFQTPEPSLGN